MNLFRAFSKSTTILTVVALAAFAASCSKSSSPTEPTTGGTSASTGSITMTSAGVSPKTQTVGFGAMVTITNKDSAPHEFASDPHPIHTDCPELNAPVLQPGQSFTATMASKVETCGFHDHLNPTNAAFQGTIFVSK
jgi:plastocyanin